MFSFLGGGGGGGSSEELANTILTELEAAAASRRNAAAVACAGKLPALAAARDSHTPLADPGRLFARCAALMAPTVVPRTVAMVASAIVSALVFGSPPRLAQARAAKETLLPALIADVARTGDTYAGKALRTIITDDPATVARARALGAVEALVQRAANLTPGPPDGMDALGAGHALHAVAEMLRVLALGGEPLREFVATPGLAEQAARWLRGGRRTNVHPRVAAARLVALVVNSPDPVAATNVLLSTPGVFQGVADCVADAELFEVIDRREAVSAAAGAFVSGGAGRVAAEILLATRNFLDGLALTLSTRPRESPAHSGPHVASVFYSSWGNASSLIVSLSKWPTRKLLDARPRLLAALDECGALARGWLASGGQKAWLPAGGYDNIFGGLQCAREALLGITDADLSGPPGPDGSSSGRAGGGARGGGGGRGGGGASAREAPAAGAAATASPAAAAATAVEVAGAAAAGGAGGSARDANVGGSSGSSDNQQGVGAAGGGATAGAAGSRRCLACGREGGGGVTLLRCGGCKGTGLDAFFCGRACQKGAQARVRGGAAAFQGRRRRQRGGRVGHQSGGGLCCKVSAWLCDPLIVS